MPLYDAFNQFIHYIIPFMILLKESKLPKGTIKCRSILFIKNVSSTKKTPHIEISELPNLVDQIKFKDGLLVIINQQESYIVIKQKLFCCGESDRIEILKKLDMGRRLYFPIILKTTRHYKPFSFFAT